jgi:protoheme IX farnesyltransferase
MLPVTHGIEYTRLQVLLYTILLAVVTPLPFLTRMSGPVYLCAAIVLNVRFLYYAIKLKTSAREDLPMRVFKFSISYLMLLFAALLLDHYLI